MHESEEATVIGKVDDDLEMIISNSGHEERHFRAFYGVGIGLSSFLAPWHMLPVLIDSKLAMDPALPGLTSTNLPMTNTALFLGWTLGSMVLRSSMFIFTKEQLIVFGNLGLIVVTLATVSLAPLTEGNLLVLMVIRFVYGLLMNIKPVQCLYVQENVRPSFKSQALPVECVIYSIIAILMAACCAGATLAMDWRLEMFLWCGLPQVVGLAVAFPAPFHILSTMPTAWSKRFAKRRAQSEPMTENTQNHGVALAMCFIACGTGFYGLTFSAGQLHPNIYLSLGLLCAIDIPGYSVVLLVDCVGKRRLQGGAFLVASICLLLCSFGEPGNPWVLRFALLGRLGLDICFITIYLILAEIESNGSVLAACETCARVGSLVAPWVGTMPVTVSCPLFALSCLIAVRATCLLPDT